MKKRILRLIALLLCAVLLAGCDYAELFAKYGVYLASSWEAAAFEDMTYTRPDMEEVEAALDRGCAAAAGNDIEIILDAVYGFYDVYDAFYTNLSLADIHYCLDLSDEYWETEYNYCTENSARLDAAMEELFRALAKSPCREELEDEEYFGAGYFEAYDGEQTLDEGLVRLLEQEAELQAEYYALTEKYGDYEHGSEEYFDVCYEEMSGLLIRLIRLRREIAQYCGYNDYTQFATDFYYYRDYTPEELETYLADIQRELVGLYRTVNRSNVWELANMPSTEMQTFRYVKEAAQAMGGPVAEAFTVMDQGNLFDISYGENKFSGSFEVYLTTYHAPYVFVNPYGVLYDRLSFAHEFGHFCCDYVSYGSYAGIDVLEVFSQGMEYLSLCYGEEGDRLTKLKMADSLCIYVEQAANSSFELQMYRLPEEKLTPQGLMELYETTVLAYGFDSVGYDEREFVDISHFYTNPLYIMSYVVSNDAAMQLYQMEQAEPGSGLKCYLENLDTEEGFFLAFLKSAGLESPFAKGRLQQVRKTFEEIFQ